VADLEPGTPLSVAVTDTSEGPVVAVQGDLDVSNADQLAAVLDPLLKQQPTRVVFDLTDLRFMDSSGIAVLLRAAAAVPVRVTRPSPIVRRVIEATGLTDALHVES